MNNFVIVAKTYLRRYPTTDIYTKILVEPLTILLLWYVIYFTRLSANTITILGVVSVITGGLLSLMYSNFDYCIIGYLLYYFADFIDGSVAKARSGYTYLGTMLDLIADRFVLSFMMIVCGVHAYMQSNMQLILMCLCYYILYVQIDLNYLAGLKAKNMFIDKKNKFDIASEVSREISIVGSWSLWVLLPSRLSSPILFLVLLLFVGDVYIAYMVAVFSVLCDYVRAYVPYMARVVMKFIK